MVRGSFRDFLAVFSPIALSPPPPSHAVATFFQQRALKFLSRRGMTYGLAKPLFSPRGRRPFYPLRSQPLLPTHPPLASTGRFRVPDGEKDGNAGAREGRKKRRGERPPRDIRVCVREIKVYYRGTSKCNHSPIHARCMTIITSFLSASLHLSSSSRFIFFNSRHFSSFSVKSLTTNVRRAARGGVERYRSPMEPQLLSTRSNGCPNVYRINDVSA